MLNKMIEWFARNTVAANLLMVGILLAGALGFMKMEREIFPTIPFNGLQVEVKWLGASPQDVEEQIVVRIEEAVSDLDNIDWVRSFASEGQASISIRTNQSVDMTQFIADVKNRVDGISSFPTDIEQPRVFQWVNRNEYIRIAVGGDMTEKELKRLAEDLRREVAKLEAISLVELFGVRNEEISIEVSENELRRYGLTIEEVANRIRNTSLNLASGTVRTESGEYKLGIRNLADTEEDFGNIIIRQTPEGGIIRVSDVATVVDGFVDQPILATMNGKPAVLIQVLTTDRMNITKASDSVNAWLEERQKTLPENVELTLWNDEADTFRSRINTIGWAAFQGLLLVLVVLLLTLRPKVAIWVTVGIATAYAGAFVFLDAAGVSLNMLSTFAFLLVLGIVVDDAIVVGESIHAESHKSGGGITAAVLGTQLVAKPVIFAVLTTIIAFMPWLFLDGETSSFTLHITWVVILALSFSLVESLFILPAHLSKMKPRTEFGFFGRMQKKVADGIIHVAENQYRGLGEWAVRNRWLTFTSFLAVLIITFAGIVGPGYVKQAFNPVIESEEINVTVTMPDGNSYERSLEILAQMQGAQAQLIAEAEERTGEEGSLIENWYTRSRRDSVIAILKLTPPEIRGQVSAKEIALRLADLIGEVPDAEEVNVRYTLDDVDPGIDFSVRHKDLDVLRDAVAALEAQLRTYDAVYGVRNNLQNASEEIRFNLKPGAEQLGLTLADVSRQVRQAYFGLEAQRLPRDGQDVRVYVRYPKAERESIESLEQFRVRTADGREVPLLSVAEVEFAPGISRIVRRDQSRSARVSGDLKDEVRGDIMKDLNENFWEGWEARFPGVERGAIGQAEGERRFFQDLSTLYLTAFFVMYMMLAIAFKSYWQPVLFLIAIPFAYVGAVIGHLLLGEVMAIFSFFGIAAAAGVVINDNLVLVDYCNRLRERGMDGPTAIVEAGVKRFRPILLTTVTTIVGLIPMMLEQSTQAAFLQPIVIALAFGVGVAFFVTLMLVPALYMCGIDIKNRTAGMFRRIGNLFRRNTPAPFPGQAE